MAFADGNRINNFSFNSSCNLSAAKEALSVVGLRLTKRKPAPRQAFQHLDTEEIIIIFYYIEEGQNQIDKLNRNEKEVIL
jgi:hypothetical protein